MVRSEATSFDELLAIQLVVTPTRKGVFRTQHARRETQLFLPHHTLGSRDTPWCWGGETNNFSTSIHSISPD